MSAGSIVSSGCVRRGAPWAFTLIEMLLVVVIIGILAGGVAVSLAGRSRDAMVTRAQSDVQASFSLALDLFEQHMGRYPTTSEGLEALVVDPGDERWRGPYLKGGLKPDPWGNPYRYEFIDDGRGQYVLSSNGPDGREGTDDDVGSDP